MRRGRRRQLVVAGIVMLLGGCWAPVGGPEVPAEWDESSDEDFESGSLSAGGTGSVITGTQFGSFYQQDYAQTDVQNPLYTDWPALSSDPLIVPSLDPFGLGLFDPIHVPALLSLFVDQLALDLLTQNVAGDEFTFLERLCLEGDTPDFVCRDRYGDR